MPKNRLLIPKVPAYPPVGTDAFKPIWDWFDRVYRQLQLASSLLDEIIEVVTPLIDEAKTDAAGTAEEKSAAAVTAEQERLRLAAQTNLLFLETPFVDPDAESLRTKVNEILNHLQTV